MKLKNIVPTRFIWVILISVFSSVIFIKGIGFAEPGMKITSPLDGTTVNSGQEITVTIESVEGFVIEGGVAHIAGSEHNENVTSLPCSFTDKIPVKAIGEVSISVFGRDASGNLAMDDVTLKVQQTATLQSLKIYTDELLFQTDWNGNVKNDYYPYIGGVYGIYSDGIKRDLTEDPNTTYTSSDPEVISIDNTGKFQVHKIGEAKITISNSGVSKIIPVVFLKRRGIKPSETIPPTISIDIQPPANEAGWHNQDITITLTAQDNEGGSGIREIFYEFPYISAESNDVADTQVVIPFSKEGVNLMRYGATDKEGNDTGQQSVEIHLDKTPPKLSITATPNILWPPNNKMVDVTINGQAIENLSGIDSLTFKVTDEYGKYQPVITGFGSVIKLEASRDGNDKDGRVYTISVTAKDRAGNESLVSTTVTVPHDMGKQGKK